MALKGNTQKTRTKTSAFSLATVLFLALISLMMAPCVFSQDVFINEVLPNPGSNSLLSWVELYNNATTAIDVTGWNLTNGTNSYILSGSIASKSFLTIDGSSLSFTLDKNTGLINLTNNASAQIDSFSYSGFLALENFSTGRYFDGYANIIAFSNTTKNSKNHLPATILLNTANNAVFFSNKQALSYNISDDFVYFPSCSIYINGSLADSQTFSVNSTRELNISYADASYSWNVTCIDGTLKTDSVVQIFSVNSTPILQTPSVAAGQTNAQITFIFDKIVSINVSSVSANFNYSNVSNANSSYIFEISGLSPATQYNYSIYFCSNLGSCNQTVQTFSTQSPPPAASCYDSIQNQDETGVDCGGTCQALYGLKCAAVFIGGSSSGGGVTVVKTKYTINITDDTPKYNVSVTTFDKARFIYLPYSYILSFSGSSTDKVSILLYPSKKTINLTLGKPVRGMLFNDTEDVQFTLVSSEENADRYAKLGIRDFIYNISIEKIKLKKETPKPKPQPIIIEKPVVEKTPEPKTGFVSIKTRSTVSRPVSELTGIAIVGAILILGTGLFLGIRKLLQ